MERQQILLPVRALILATLLVSSIAVAQDGEPQSAADPASAMAPLGTGFTYQGRLDQNGTPVNDTCDMDFRLYDDATGGVQVGSAITATVPITDGLFTVTLDFGAGAFDGERRWLGIGVDCDGVGTYADLGRQELTAAPQALYAMGAPWSGLAGVPAGFADGVDDDTTYTAGDGLVLDGTEFSAQGSPYANVVVVAQSGGDYTSVQAAIDSITDATEGNLYLVWVAPGVYSETVAMKPYVHLQGAGQEATVITSTVTDGSWPPSQATLVLTRSTNLRDLTVGSGGTDYCSVALMATAGTTRTLVADVTARAQGVGLYNYAIYLTGSGTGVTLQHVTGLAENGTYNYGLRNDGGSQAVLRGGYFTAQGGGRAYGIYSTGSGTLLEAMGVTALGENGSDSNYGLHNDDGATAMLYGGFFTALGENGGPNYGLINTNAKATLHGSSFTARGGNNTYGVSNDLSDATLEAEGITALGENGSDSNHGLYITHGAVAVLHGGSFTARGGDLAYGIYSTGSGTLLDATAVTALAEDGSVYSYGLENNFGAAAVLHGGSFTARGMSRPCGIYNTESGATLDATAVTALGENGSDHSFGLWNRDGAAATLHGGSFTGRGGGGWTCGIFNFDSGATLEATAITALGEDGGAENFGLQNHDATAKVDGSRITGSTLGLYLYTGSVYLGVTQLDGGAVPASGTLTCFQVYDSSYSAYSCPP